MKRTLLWCALVPLVILGISRPSLDRGIELSSGEFDSNSDCVVRGDLLIYHTPANLIDGILGGHGRGFETFEFNRQSFRVVFSDGSDEIELVRVRDCEAHVRGEAFSIDGNSVDSVFVSRRGRTVVDRTPDRGFGPAREVIIRVPGEKTYLIRASDTDLDTFDLAAPLIDAKVLVIRGLEGKGQGMRYEVFDYARARRLRFQISTDALPKKINQVLKIKADTIKFD